MAHYVRVVRASNDPSKRIPHGPCCVGKNFNFSHHHAPPPRSSISRLRRAGLDTITFNFDELLTVSAHFFGIFFPLSGVGTLWPHHGRHATASSPLPSPTNLWCSQVPADREPENYSSHVFPVYFRLPTPLCGAQIRRTGLLFSGSRAMKFKPGSSWMHHCVLCVSENFQSSVREWGSQWSELWAQDAYRLDDGSGGSNRAGGLGVGEPSEWTAERGRLCRGMRVPIWSRCDRIWQRARDAGELLRRET